MPPARLTPEQKEIARQLYQQDTSLTVEAVARMFDVPKTVMLRALAGATRPRGGLVKSTLSTETMIEMRDAGMTLAQIGNQAGLTESGVYRRIQKGRTK
ncbi:hypothetical protein [Blastococcus sp. SYSU DS0973]